MFSNFDFGVIYRSLSYLFIDGIAERIRPGSRREPVLAAWRDGRVPLDEYPAGSDGPSDW